MTYGGAALGTLGVLDGPPVATIEFPATVTIAVGNMINMSRGIMGSRLKLDKKIKHIDDLIDATMTIMLRSLPRVSVAQYVSMLVPAGAAIPALVVDDPVYGDLAAFNASIQHQFTAENIERFFSVPLASYMPERRALVRAYRQGTNVNVDDYDPCLIVKLKLAQFKDLLEDISHILKYSEDDYDFDETRREENDIDRIFKKYISFFLNEHGHMEYGDILKIFKVFMRVLIIYKFTEVFARQSGVDVLISALNQKIETYIAQDVKCSKVRPPDFRVRPGANGLPMATQLTYHSLGSKALNEIVEILIGRTGINETKKWLEYAADATREKITRHYTEFQKSKELLKQRGIRGNIMDLLISIYEKASAKPRIIRILQSLPTLMFSLIYNPSLGHYPGASQSSQYENMEPLTIDEMIQSEDAPVIDPSVLNLLALLSSSKPKGRRRDHKVELLMLNSNGYSGNNDRRGTSRGRKGRGPSEGRAERSPSRGRNGLNKNGFALGISGRPRGTSRERAHEKANERKARNSNSNGKKKGTKKGNKKNS